jgi:hypothetical protein
MARSRKRGSVGRCQLWYCHGLMRSARSQRWMVAPEMRRTMPRWTTARRSSVTDRRESGLPQSRGRVQANAVTCARTAEGKKAWTSGSEAPPRESARPTPPSPLPHRPIRATHGSGDGGVAPLRVLVGQEQNPRSHDFRMRGGSTARQTLELSVLWRRKGHLPSRFGSTAPAEAWSRCTHRTHDTAGPIHDPKNPVRIHDPVY